MKEFHSITAFVEHLAAAELAMRHSLHHGLDKAAAVIERDAKAKFGEYQPDVPPYNAWAELAEATKRDRVARGFSENDPLLRSGGLRDSVSRRVEGLEAQVGSTSDVMVYQELGTPTIPPRPVLGPAAVESREQVSHILSETVVKTMEYGRVGEFVALPT
jgi:hypothetical protein